MTLVGAVRGLQALAALLAVLVTRRRGDHRPIAVFLVSTTAANMLRVALQTHVLYPAHRAVIARGLDPAAVPLSGAARAAGHVEQALFLCWPAAVAALAIAVFARTSPWPVVPAHGAVVTGLILGYPTVRGDLLRRAYLGVELASLAAAIGCFALWFRRKEAMTIPRFCALAIIGIECGTLIGPWLGDPFTTWARAQALYVVLYVTLVVLQGGALCPSSSISRQG